MPLAIRVACYERYWMLISMLCGMMVIHCSNPALSSKAKNNQNASLKGSLEDADDKGLIDGYIISESNSEVKAGKEAAHVPLPAMIYIIGGANPEQHRGVKLARLKRDFSLCSGYLQHRLKKEPVYIEYEALVQKYTAGIRLPKLLKDLDKHIDKLYELLDRVIMFAQAVLDNNQFDAELKDRIEQLWPYLTNEQRERLTTLERKESEAIEAFSNNKSNRSAFLAEDIALYQECIKAQQKIGEMVEHYEELMAQREQKEAQ